MPKLPVQQHNEHGTLWRTPALAPDDVRRLLADPAWLVWQYLDRPVKLTHDTVIVTAELQVDGQSLAVAYKQYRRRGLWKTFWRLFRTGPALRAYRMATALVGRGIPTPRPIAAREPLRRRWFDPSYLATEWIADSENLHLFGWRLAERPLVDRLAQAAAVAESLGRLIGRMHAVGITHRDLKWANLLVVSGDALCPGAPAAEFPPLRTMLVDVDGARLVRRVPWRRRAADLARLAVGLAAHPWITPGVWRQFYRAYLAQLPTDKNTQRLVWRATAWRARRLIRKKRRRGIDVL
jgi:tRNA A-37 threonylcarbamoyl transferase component Bud32